MTRVKQTHVSAMSSRQPRLFARNAALYANWRIELKESRLRKAYILIKEEGLGRLLDIGCGAGEFGETLRQAGWQVWGVDLHRGQVGEARRRGVSAIVGDVEHGLPYARESFDCVFAGEIIEHVLDTDLLVSEFSRVLRKGGCVVITTPNLASLENRLRLLLGRYPLWLDYRLGGHGHVRGYTPRVLKEQLISHGFVIERHKGNWIPLVPQRFLDDIKCRALAITGDMWPSLAMDIVLKARKGDSL